MPKRSLTFEGRDVRLGRPNKPASPTSVEVPVEAKIDGKEVAVVFGSVDLNEAGIRDVIALIRGTPPEESESIDDLRGEFDTAVLTGRLTFVADFSSGDDEAAV